MADSLAGTSRRSALALAGATVSGVATILTVVIATRSLSGDGAGEYFVAVALFAIGQGLASLGAETGLQYFVPTMPTDSARRLIARIEAASGIIGLILGALVFAGAAGVAAILTGGDGSEQATENVIRFAALTLPFAGLYEVSMGALRACDEVVASSLLDRVIRPIAQVLAMVAAAAAGWGSTGMYLAWVFPILVTVLVAVLRLRSVQVPELGDHVVEVTRSVFWRYTGPRAVARVAQVLTQRLDVLILAAVFSLQDAAVYGAASRCMIAGVFLANALNQTIQPQLRREIAFGTRQTVREMYEATTTWLVLATWPLYIVMITHASIFMSIFGPEYASGGPVLSLLSSAMLVAIACGLVDVVLLMLGRSWLSTINVVVALVVNVTLNLLLAPHLGMIGSAIAWVAAILIGNLAPLFQTSRVGLHPGGRPLWTGCLITGLAFGLPLGVERLVFGSGVPAFVIALSISAVLYVVLLRLFRTWMLLDRLVDGLRSKASRPALPA